MRQKNYKTTLRWLSILPIMFTVLVLSDWAVRFFFWFIRLPIIIFEHFFNFATSPIRDFFDRATNSLVGVDSIETITIIVTGLLTGYMIIHIPIAVSTSNRKKTAKILTVIHALLIGGVFLLWARYLFFMGWSSFSSLMHNTLPGSNLLMGIFLSIGIVFALHSAKTQTEEEHNKYEKIISNNILTIFISSVSFTVLIMTFFLS